MPETLNHDDLDEFDLHDLAMLAPTDLSAAAPEWGPRRDQLLAEVMPQRRNPWLLRSGIAAAVLAVVAGGVYAVNRPTTAMPAGPVASSTVASSAHPSTASAPAAATQPFLRTIEPGHRILRRWHETSPGEASTVSAGDHTGLVSYEADGTEHEWYDGGSEKVDRVSGLPTEVPTDTYALKAYLLSGQGTSYKPVSPNATTTPAPEADLVWENVVGWVQHPLVSPDVKQQLLQLAAQTSGATVEQATLDGRAVVRLSYTYKNSYPHHKETIILDRTSLQPVQEVEVLAYPKGWAKDAPLVEVPVTTTFTVDYTTEQPKP